MKRFFVLFACLLGVFIIWGQRDPGETGQAAAIESECFFYIGQPLSALEKEFPEGEIFYRTDGLPHAALLCFGEERSGGGYLFFGTQGIDFLPCMEQYPEQVNCCGVSAPVSELFPVGSEVVPLSEFFAGIGISEYHYEAETDIALGWVTFSFGEYTVYLNTNRRDGQGWTYTGVREVRADAPAVVLDSEVEVANVRLFQEHFAWE